MALAALATTSSAASLRAADVSWDNASSNSLWDTTSLNWSGAAWNNAAGNGAIFGPAAPGAINVPGPINVNSMSFTANGYTLNGPGPFTLVNGTSTQTTGVINVGGGVQAQINVPINSAVGFQKMGGGTLELSGPGSYTAAIPIDPRAVQTAGLLIGGFLGPQDGGTLRVMNSSAIPASTNVCIGEGYLDIGGNNQVVNNLIFANKNPNKPWNTTLNANNGVVGSGTLRVAGEISVVGSTGGNFGNTIAANVDLGGGTQVVRVGSVSSAILLERGLMFTGSLSNGSLLKTIGTNHNGVQATPDGISLLGNNTYTGATILNQGVNVATGTNATTSIKIAGIPAGLAGSQFSLQGANGSAQGATLIQAVAGGTFILDNNAALGAAGFNQPNIPAAQNNDRIRDDAVIELRDGNFAYRGLAATTATETFGSMNLVGGHNIVQVVPNNVGTATVTGAGNFTMGPRSTALIQTLTTGTGNSGNALGGNAQLKFNGTVPTGDATGILPRVVSTNDFVTYSASTGFTPLTTYAPDFTTPNTNVSIAASTTVASSVDINALRNTAGGNTTLTIGAGQVLGVNSGMILNSGFGSGTVTGGTVAFGPNPGVLFGTGNILIASAITGTDGLISARGTNTLLGDLSGLSGSLDVYSGTMNLTTNTFAGPINVRNGTLNVNVSQTAGGPITLGVPQNDANLVPSIPTLNIAGAGANATISRDIIVDNGAQTVAGVPLRYGLNTGLTPLSNSSGTQTLTGNITLNTGLRLQGGGATGATPGATVFAGNITGQGTFFMPNGRAVFSGTYSNAGGFNVGDQGFTMKAIFTGTGSGNGTMTISGGNNNTVSYEAGALQGGFIRVWNSSSGTQPEFIPLENSTINNTIILGQGGTPGEEGDARVNVGAGINAEWAGPLQGYSPLTKIGTGELNLSNATSTYTGNLVVNDGMLRASHAQAFGTPTLTVNGGTARLSPGLGTAMTLRGVSVNLGAGKFDISNNAVVVDYTPPAVTPFASIQAAIVSGYNGGGASAWTGNGITTSNGNASEFAIGYAEASDLTTIPAVFGSVDATAVLFRQTRYGDADLNGLVNLDDFNRLAGNFGGFNKVWSQGDFDYNGSVNLNDFNMLAANFGLSAGSDGVVGPDDWAALGSAVPEPSSTVLVLASGLACLRRRRSASAKS